MDFGKIKKMLLCINDGIESKSFRIDVKDDGIIGYPSKEFFYLQRFLTDVGVELFYNIGEKAVKFETDITASEFSREAYNYIERVYARETFRELEDLYNGHPVTLYVDNRSQVIKDIKYIFDLPINFFTVDSAVNIVIGPLTLNQENLEFHKKLFNAINKSILEDEPVIFTTSEYYDDIEDDFSKSLDAVLDALGLEIAEDSEGMIYIVGKSV